MRRRSLAVSLGVLLAWVAPAYAGDPIMGLSQVHRGMTCTGYSVVQGTDISSFRADVIDVVAGGTAAPQVLVTVSGPAVDVTGVAEGFSGSPIFCPDAQGVQRNIGAIADGVGDYGNKLALVTPIEAILGEPVDPPAGTRNALRLLRSARPLAAPLLVTGLPPGVARALDAAARRAHRRVVSAAPAPRFAFAAQTLQPGSSLAVGISSGAIGMSAIGTVTYTDGANVWGFGHPLDDVGRRSLLLQDAYVYTVVNNPVDADQLTSYKLAAPGHDIGTLTNDASAGVVGRMGPLPARIPLQVSARDGDTGIRQYSETQVADESPVDQPSGTSGLSAVGPLAVVSAGESLLHGMPANQTGSMCVRISVRERSRRLGFCNSYVESGVNLDPSGGGVAAVESAMASDFSDALTLLDAFDAHDLHITNVALSLTLQRGLRQASIVSASARRTVRAGSRMRVRLRIKRRHGGRQTILLRVRVPARLRPGRHVLTLVGLPLEAQDTPDEDAIAKVVAALTGKAPSSDKSKEEAPQSLAELADAIAAIHRDDGVLASFSGRRGRGSAPSGQLAYRDPQLRIAGSTQLRVTVRPARGSRRRR
jgi:hypothetical protein